MARDSDPGVSKRVEPDELPVAIPIVEEQLEVSRRVVETGGAVRIRKVVHDDHVSVAESRRTETVEVTRKPIGRRVDGPVAVRYEGDVTIFPVVQERLVISKQLVLVEELHVRRVPRIEDVPKEVTLRREEAIVERRLPGSEEWRIETPESAQSELEVIREPHNP